MDVVYRAHDEVLDRDVALKFLAVLILRCLVREPAERFQRASEVRNALNQPGSLYPGIRDRIRTEQGSLR